LRRANAELAEERRVLRASEERSRLAFSIAGACAWELDPTTGLSRWDTTARTLFGLPDVLPFVDAVAGFVHHNDLSSVHEAVAAALDPVGGGHYAVEHRAAEHLSASGTQWLQSLGQAYFEGAGAARRPVRLVCVTTDVTQRRAADERRALLVAELNHRVKNTLAIVQALAEQTRRATDKRSPGSPERRQFHTDFQSRLLALARAHDLLTREEWQGTTLRDILATAAELFGKAPPHGTSPQNEVAKLEIDGPAVRIGPEATVTLTMGIHELATNAAKHGALSMPGGRVTVTWKIVPDRSAVDVLWAEAGGPPVAGPPPSERHGFGLRLLERGLARQLGGSVHLDFVTDGLRCRIRLPLSGGRVAQR
jgi:two-component sensor histidine kinase